MRHDAFSAPPICLRPSRRSTRVTPFSTTSPNTRSGRHLRIPGIEDTDEAYDALNSALAVNFNTIHAVRRGKTVRSAEKQTPITPLAISQFRARGPNGRSRISLTQEDPSVGVQYAGELLAAFIERAGGSVKGEISTGSVPEGLEPVYVHRQSRILSEILTQMLLGSNNYIANQVFLEIGAHRLGGPVSLKKSLQVAREILADHGSGGNARPAQRQCQLWPSAEARRPAHLPACRHLSENTVGRKSYPGPSALFRSPLTSISHHLHRN
jgi:hypothetical protein